MSGRLQAWRALPGRERLRLLQLAAILPIVELALAAFGYVRTRRVIERITARDARHAASAAELADARASARLAAIAGRHGPVEATCLRQSLLLYGLLRWRGLDPQLRIGVRKADAALDAHAWVELDGHALDPKPPAHRSFEQA